MAAMAVVAGYCDRNYRVRAGKANRWGAVAAPERVYSAGGFSLLGMEFSEVAGLLGRERAGEGGKGGGERMQEGAGRGGGCGWGGGGVAGGGGGGGGGG